MSNTGATDGSTWTGPPLAEIGPRLIAALIDWVAPVILMYVVFIIAAAADLWILILVAYLALLAFQIWNLIQEGSTGQTVGKKMQNIKLVDMQTLQPVGFGKVLLRVILNGIIYGIGWLFALWTPLKQTLGDSAVSKSVVIQA